MTREEIIQRLDDSLEGYMGDDEIYDYIHKRAAMYLKKDYPPVSGKDKEIKEMCNVFLAYYDAMFDADEKGLDVEEADFGNIVYDMMHELLGDNFKAPDYILP